MNSVAININARYRLEPSKADPHAACDVIDRARELQFQPAIVFSNGSEQECRAWVLRNCEEPGEHTPGPWSYSEFSCNTSNKSVRCRCGEMIAMMYTLANHSCTEGKDAANAHLMATAPKLLALLEQYHASMPTKESGKLICEARNWLI